MPKKQDPMSPEVKCKEFKLIYDKCYNHWHKAMRKGVWEPVPCDDEFDDYKECYVVSRRLASSLVFCSSVMTISLLCP